VLLRDINITFMEPCVADKEKIRLKAELSDNITEVMPYLNTVIGNAIFNKDAPLLTFTKEFRLIVLYSPRRNDNGFRHFAQKKKTSLRQEASPKAP